MNKNNILQKGTDALKSGNIQFANSCYTKILKLEPDHPEANYKLGLLLLSENDTLSSIKFFSNAIRKEPENTTFWISYFEALVKIKNFGKAKKVYDHLLKKDVSKEKLALLKKQLFFNNNAPSNEQCILLTKYFNNGFKKEAEDLANSIIKKFPNHQLSWKIIGALLTNKLKFSDALVAIQKSIELDPFDENAHCNLAISYTNLKKYKLAENSYEKGVKLFPNSSDIYTNYGIFLFNLGRLKEAEIKFTKAINLEPNLCLALENRGKIFFNNGDYRRALKDFILCTSEYCREKSLYCLYHLNKIKEIYRKIYINREQDAFNIGISAFCAFISFTKKKDTGHLFCPNPLKFIYYSNISLHIKKYDYFVDELIEELKNKETIWEPVQTSTHNGFQGVKNIFEKAEGNICDLKSIILKEIDDYYIKFKNSDCLFIKNWPKHKFIKGWHLILKKQGYQEAHIHETGWLSGVIYLKTVPHLENDEGAIEFSLNGEHYFNRDVPVSVFHPKKGDIVFFPSSLNHRTIPFTTNTDRIIIAFDLVPSF